MDEVPITGNQQCLEDAIFREDKKYVGEWVLIVDERVAYHGPDGDELLAEVRKAQKRGVSPLVHYVGDEHDAFLL